MKLFNQKFAHFEEFTAVLGENSHQLLKGVQNNMIIFQIMSTKNIDS